MNGSVPDNSMIGRIRTALTNEKAYDKLLALMNNQLESKGILIRTGAIVDASITDAPGKYSGKMNMKQWMIKMKAIRAFCLPFVHSGFL